MHNFSVQLVNNDHTPLMPMVLSQNTVEVMGSDNVSAEGVTVDLAARNIRFNKSTITVPAGAHVTMNFDNQESVPHNFALYDDSQAENVIFKAR
jgi:plastocyanin